VAEDVDDAGLIEVGTMDVGVILEIMDGGMVGEEEIDTEGSLALRTRNPGLERSGVLGSNACPAILNRRTYFGSVRLLSGIAIVHAKFPDRVRLTFS